MSESNEESNLRWNPHAAIAGWLVPGLGHVILGQRRRGIILCIAITSLWLTGLLIGGISVIDKYDRGEPPDSVLERYNRGEPVEYVPGRSWWYYGQAMIAPSIAIDAVRRSMAAAHAEKLGHVNDPNPPGRLLPSAKAPPPYEPSFGRVAEQGTLYTALAGMLNLLAIIDVLYCDPRARRQQFTTTPVRPAHIAEAQA